MKKESNFYLLIFLGFAAIIIASMISLVFGSVNIPFGDLWSSIVKFNPDNMNHHIMWDLRIPRTLGDILVGAALAASGAIMQGMTRNPLADSGILGINSGSVFALSLCFALAPAMSYPIIVIFSFIGAGFSVFVVYGLTSLRRGKQSPIRLVLAGTAVGSLLSAISQGIALYFMIGKEITFWTVGGIAGIGMNQVLGAAPFLLTALIMAVYLSRSLSILSIGEDAAKGLGLNMKRTKLFCMAAVLLLAGGAVALAGPISFLGLIIPHIVRHYVGIDYRKIMPLSIITGSLFMLMADIISRLINPPHETPIGLIFSIIGVPFFLYISRKGRREIGA